MKGEKQKPADHNVNRIGLSCRFGRCAPFSTLALGACWRKSSQTLALEAVFVVSFPKTLNLEKAANVFEFIWLCMSAANSAETLKETPRPLCRPSSLKATHPIEGEIKVAKPFQSALPRRAGKVTSVPELQ